MSIVPRTILVLFLLLGGLSGHLSLVQADSAEDSLQEVIDRVEHDNDCKVLSVQTIQHHGGKVYVIKTLTKDGRVKVVQVRASQ